MAVKIEEVNNRDDLLGGVLPPGTLRALQLTDTHLYADPEGSLLGINTLETLSTVIDSFRDHDWPIDLLLATGDLVHDSSPTGYARIGRLLDSFGVPVYSLPGNHDIPAIMRKHLPTGQVSTQRVNDLGGWRFVMLDSVIAGEDGGRLEPSELNALAEALDGTRQHVLVCLHHQPINVGSAWIDTMTITNPDELFAVLDASEQVRGVLWGHIHQRFDATRNGIPLMASPSTCVQFAPKQDDFTVDEAPPGFRLIALLPDGEIRTQVLRIERMPHGLEIASSGY